MLTRADIRDTALLLAGRGACRVGALDEDRILELAIANPPVGTHEQDALSGRPIEATHVSALRFRVDDVRVGRIGGRVEAVTARDGGPHRVGDRPLFAAAWSAPA